MHRIATFPRDDHYRVPIAMWARDVCSFTGLWIKEQKNGYCTDYSYGFKGLNVQIARVGGGLIGETNIPVQKIWLKMGGGLIHRGGGTYGRDSTVLSVSCVLHRTRSLSHLDNLNLGSEVCTVVYSSCHHVQPLSKNW